MVVLSVVDNKLILGINNPEFVLFISKAHEASGDVVPIPT